MPASIDELLWKALGYGVALLVILLPIVLLRWVMATRWFANRRRMRWAGERIAPMSLRDPMDELGPLGVEPPRKGRRR